jgi:hypothetical protein
MERKTDTEETASSFDFMVDDGRRLRSPIGNLLIAQLEAIAPASLSLQTLLRGVACGCPGATAGDVGQVLRDLQADGLVVKISECGFVDRFRLVERDGGEAGEVDR